MIDGNCTDVSILAFSHVHIPWKYASRVFILFLIHPPRLHSQRRIVQLFGMVRMLALLLLGGYRLRFKHLLILDPLLLL
jgi:hypothetical protein